MSLPLSIVVPVRNEAGNIRPLVREIRDAMAGRTFELLYVDDGSDDGTAAELERARAEELPELRILRHGRPGGQSAALRTGVEAARHDWIATLDGDGQNDPADIPRLAALVEAPDHAPDLRMVASIRRERRDSWVRRVSSRIANRVRSRVLNDGMKDSASGLKLFARDAYLALPYFDHMHRFLPALVQRQGGRVATLAANHRPRLRGTSKYGIGNRLWVGIVDLWGVRWLQRRYSRPAVEER